MKGTNKRSGISLIVLVITIIVIIILAVAVILTLSNNNPIENAKKAVSANDEATLKEEATLLYADWYMKKNLDGEDVGDANDYVKDNLQGDYGELVNRLTVTNEGVITIGEEASGPVIPNGFEYYTGTVDTGYVIKNSTDGNEFVWVPVEAGTFVREDGYYNGILQDSVSSDEVVEPYEEEGYTSEREEYDAMVASVSKYGGFYIARYEASDNGSGLAQSLPNKTPWDFIVWGTTMTDITGGVVEVARAVYPDSKTKTTGDAVSTLPYGVQWDVTVRFLETNYPGIAQGSTGYGNYSTTDEDDNYIYEASMINTGSNPQYALNNIYDLAGNVEEWTMESYSSDYRAVRGGSFGWNGSDFPVSVRLGEYPENNIDGFCKGIGFRLALYIK